MVKTTYIPTKDLQEEIKINYVSINDLILDDQNPRFAGSAESMSEEKLLDKLKKEMHLEELIDSFRENGYFNTEPLLVIPYKKQRNRFTVVEGNRRLAAIKILLKARDKYKISGPLRKQLTESIPVAIYPDRKTLWTYLTFRHINGPQVWDSYSKAVYALRVHENYRIPIDDIITRIGDRSRTVVKMINGLRVLNQASEEGFFKKERIELRRFYFSHLYTILQYDDTLSFLGIKHKKGKVLKKNPISPNKIQSLELLLSFLFGSQDGSLKPVIQSQNPDLRRLNKVLGNKEAVACLKENSQVTGALEIALSYTGMKDPVLTDLIYKALNILRKIKGMMYTYRGEPELRKRLKEINEVVTDLIDEAKRKKK